MSRKLTTSEFVEKCNSKHDNKYEYDKTIYVNSHTKVIVTCKKHGDFEILAYSHVNGNNCYKCYEEQRNKRIIPKVKYSRRQFIEICNKVHKNKFDYSNINYESLKSELKLTCPFHGEIIVNAGVHLNGHDCKFCSNEKRSMSQLINIEENIQIFNNVHNYKYDYSLININKNFNSHYKIKIICKEHGVFVQQLSSHKNGNGCKKCANKNSGNMLSVYKNNPKLGNEIGIFYKLKFKHKRDGFEFLKIGITKRSIKLRYNNKMYNDYEITILEEIKDTCLNTAIMESDFKSLTKLNKFIFPENVKFVGWTECYELENQK